MVGGDKYPVRTAFARALGNPHDHGLATDVGESLPWKTGGRQARRDDGGKRHTKE
jgi:hypothetical protein